MAERPRLFVISAVLGVLVIVFAIAAVVIALINRGGESTNTTPPTSEPTVSSSAPTSEPSPTNEEPENVTAKGWVAEPITTDPAVYADAALRAVSTFDTTLATREEFVAYLETWLTPQVGNTSTGEISEDMTERNREAVSNDIVVPEDQWAYIAPLGVTAIAEITEPTPDVEDGVTQGWASEATTTFQPGATGGTEEPWAETRRLDVLVSCHEWSVPTQPGQEPGDCKVVRWSLPDSE